MDLLDSNLTGAKAAALFFSKDEDRDFHSIPVGKKLCFHCRDLNYQRLGKRLVFLTGCMCGANNKSLGDERIDKQLATESRFTGSFFPMGMARPWW